MVSVVAFDVDLDIDWNCRFIDTPEAANPSQ
jgi:hypothetical protein